MKILMLMPEPGRAGAAKVFEQHCKDFRSFAIVKRVYFTRSAHLIDGNESEGICYLDDYRFTKKTGSIGRFLNRIFALRKLSRDEKTDLIISHLDGANYVNSACPVRAKKIIVIHGTTLIRKTNTIALKRLIHSLSTRFLYRWSDVVVPVGRDLGIELKNLYGIKSIYPINNYLDIKAIKEAASNEEVLIRIRINKRFKIVSHGRLVPNKNLDLQINILSILKGIGLSVSLILVGDGSDRDRLIAYCNELGLSFSLGAEEDLDNKIYDVYFIGFLKNPYTILKNCDMFMLTSKYEGFPLSICEAMIFGLPIVAANCPTGPREILSYVNSNKENEIGGVLMPPVENNAEADIWINAITPIINDNDYRIKLKQKSFQRAEYFSREVIVEKWKILIDSLVVRNV